LGIPGAWVERKGATLSYHIRDTAVAQRREAERRARQLLKRRQLRVVVGKCVVEARPPVEWHKGHAALHVLVQRHGANWPSRVRALYIGDDTTDEDAFRSLRGIGRSICVAPKAPAGGTVADYRLPDPDAVLPLVRWLASGAFAAPPA
jgi:trehalose 6-phosphate phosphatase